jgi:hypothetical protein
MRKVTILRSSGPTTDSCAAALFYHVIGDGKQRRWDVEAKGLGRFQINDEFEAGGLYDG